MLLNPDRFETDVLGSAKPVLVDFFATWCGPCRHLAPTIERIAQDGYAVCKVNVDHHPDLAKRYGVAKLPTLVVLKDGTVVTHFEGVQSEQTLRNALDSAEVVAIAD